MLNTQIAFASEGSCKTINSAYGTVPCTPCARHLAETRGALLVPQSSPSLEELHRLSYTKAARGRARVQSALPSAEEAEALFQLDADLFTPEAVEGMRECGSLSKTQSHAQAPHTAMSHLWCWAYSVAISDIWRQLQPTSAGMPLGALHMALLRVAKTAQ